MSRRVEVSAAVIERPDGTFLMASRPQGKVYAGWWEFPGGKVEPGETPRHALDRELVEELGITVRTAYPWLVREYDYEHARVRLNFFRVLAWAGEPHPHEGQGMAWVHAVHPEVTPILPANGPILKGLSLPLTHGISAATELGVETFLGRLEARLEAGLKLVQLRDKGLPGDVLARLAREVAARCRAHGAVLLINGDRRLAEQCQAGLHLPAAQLRDLDGRPDLPWVGASCHDAGELDQAARLELDYALLGPVRPTPSHPGAATLDWQGFRDLAAGRPLPVYALGGLTRDDLDTARQAGGHGIALKSALWAEPMGALGMSS